MESARANFHMNANYLGQNQVALFPRVSSVIRRAEKEIISPLKDCIKSI